MIKSVSFDKIKITQGVGSHEVIDSDRGKVMNVTASENIVMEGKHHVEYSANSDTLPRGASLDHEWSTKTAEEGYAEYIEIYISNETTSEKITITILYRVYYSYCGRRDDFSADLNFNGTWNNIRDNGKTVCE